MKCMTTVQSEILLMGRTVLLHFLLVCLACVFAVSTRVTVSRDPRPVRSTTGSL